MPSNLVQLTSYFNSLLVDRCKHSPELTNFPDQHSTASERTWGGGGGEHSRNSESTTVNKWRWYFPRTMLRWCGKQCKCFSEILSKVHFGVTKKNQTHLLSMSKILSQCLSAFGIYMDVLTLDRLTLMMYRVGEMETCMMMRCRHTKLIPWRRSCNAAFCLHRIDFVSIRWCECDKREQIVNWSMVA